MADMKRLIGAILAVVVGILVYTKLGKFEGGPVSVPDEAVPVWANSDLPFVNRFLEYFFPLLIPVGSMISCPLTPPYDGECMSKARKATGSVQENAWDTLINTSHDETVIKIDRDETEEPLEVVLLHPKNQTTGLTDAPLILWVHSGGFTTGSAREMYVTYIINALRDDESASQKARDAVWAIVEYRVAPEFSHPAAADDCILALEHLLSEYAVDGKHLGGGGIHVAGLSAGGTIAVTSVLRMLQAGIPIDSMLADEPVMILPERYGDADQSPLDSLSFRRNAFTRVVPVRWIDWSLAAYLGRPLDEITSVTDLDLTGGAMSALEWKKVTSGGDDEHQKQELPPLVLFTAKADGLRDGGVAFGRVYKEAGGAVYHLEASCSHAFGFVFDIDSAREMVRTWARLIETAPKKTIETMVES